MRPFGRGRSVISIQVHGYFWVTIMDQTDGPRGIKLGSSWLVTTFQALFPNRV